MGANTVTFRSATKADARTIASLFRIASEGVADYIWSLSKNAADGNTDLLDIGTQRYERENKDFSYQNCDLAEIDGEVVGMLHAYPMKTEPGSAPPECDPVLRPYAELTEPGSLFVTGLAIFDDYRGQGIGTRLLDHAYRRTLIEGLKKTSLICFANNKRAFKLYELERFEPAARRPVVPHPLIRHTGDAVLMVRPL